MRRSMKEKNNIRSSLEKEKDRKNLFEVEEVVKKLKKEEKSQFLQIFCKYYWNSSLVTLLIKIREVDKNVQDYSCS